MGHNGIKEDKTTTLVVNLRKDISCNRISRQRGFMPIQLLDLVDTSVQDGIVVCGANGYAIGVLKLLGDSRKLRPVVILWQHYLHIQICVVKHIWRITVDLGNCVVVIDLQKFLFEVFVLVYVFGPILRVRFIANIVFSNDLQLIGNHGVDLIKYILSVQRTFLEVCDALYGGVQYHVDVLIQYAKAHVTFGTFQNTKPPTRIKRRYPCVILEPNLVIEHIVKILQNFCCLPHDLCEQNVTSQPVCCRVGEV